MLELCDEKSSKGQKDVDINAGEYIVFQEVKQQDMKRVITKLRGSLVVRMWMKNLTYG